MQFEAIAAGVYLEGLAVTGEDVWCADVIGGGVRRVRGGASETWLAGTRWLAALLPMADGRMLLSGADGITWLDPQTGATGSVVAAAAGTAIPGVNEMAPDGKGGLYFGTVDLPAIQRGQTPAPAALFRLAADGTVTQVAHGLSFTNGLALNAEGTRLYHNQSFDGVHAYPVATDGSLGAATRLLEKHDCDGMALDAAGGIWVSGFASGDLLRLLPDGTIDRRLELPGRACTNVRFGGADARDLYVNIVDPETVAALVQGTEVSAETSFLHRGRAEIAGYVPPPVALDPGCAFDP